MTSGGSGSGAQRGRGRSGPVRRWLAGRTLRGRLVAAMLVLLALACAAVGIASYVSLNQGMLRQLDTQLDGAAHRYDSCLSTPTGDLDHEHTPPSLIGPKPNAPQVCANEQGEQTFTAQIRKGAIVNAYVADGGQVKLTTADKRVLGGLAYDGRPYSLTLPSLSQGYRMMAEPCENRPDMVCVVGMPLRQTQATLRAVELVELVVFAAALLLAGILAMVWVRLSLRPLRRVAATATRVTQLPLGAGDVALPERVPDMDPRTEVGQVGAAFNRMLGHVEAALGRRAASEARLRRFAADASHELRTPLAAIRGYAELARRHPGPVPGDIAHALSRVESESARMSVLVDELLLLAQLDAGRPLARDPVDLTRLAIDATSDARVAAPTHKWQLELPGEPVTVCGDEHRLRQVLANLLSNAAKHTPPGTTATVSLEDPDPATGTVTLRVTDDGPGIPPDLQPGLFERFVRGDTARSHATGSTGLGLAIVDAVTAAHGGSVSVSSKPGWTQFVITLPGSEESLTTPGTPPA